MMPSAALAQRLSTARAGAAASSTASIATAIRARPAAPHVDGVLDDEAWTAAAVFSDFVQQDPNEGDPVSEPTEFRVLYTDDALYVAVRAWDSDPQDIAAVLSRRDEWSPSDEVTIAIDSYHDRRTGFSFSVNAAGVKRDSYLYNDNEQDSRWDAVWDAAVQVDPEGWTAEFRIPFSQLRFSSGAAHTFGFNVTRRLNRLNEVQQWRLRPKDASGVVSLFGDLNGINGVAPPRRMEILPYVVASATRATAAPDDPFNTGRAQAATAGVDLKFGVTSALTLTATVNPDFGQVEADPAVVNLSNFETFFPERRPFFNEGLDIFRFPLGDGDGDGAAETLFYTRRIGRTPQGEADPRGGYAETIDNSTILTAAKLSGKTASGWTMGLTGALTGRERARVIDASGNPYADVVEPLTGYLVGRLARDLRGGQTVVGVFGTTVQRDLPPRLEFLHQRAYTGGLDWSHRFRDNTYQFSGRIVASRVEGTPEALLRTQTSSARYYQRPDADYLEVDSSATSLTGYQVAMNVGKTAGAWRGAVGVDTRTPGLEVNDVGFQREADNSSQWVWVNRRWLKPGSVFRRFNLNLNQWSSWTYGWDRRNLGGNVNANYTLWNYWNGHMGINRGFGGVSVSQLRGGPAINQPGSWNGWFGFETDERRSLRGGAFGYGFLQDENDSWGAGVGVDLAWRPRSNVDLTVSPGLDWNHDDWQYLQTDLVQGSPEYTFGELRQTTASATVRANVTFTPTLSLQVYAQPFVSAGQYVGYRRVVAPRARPFLAQFESFSSDQIFYDDGSVSLDVTGDGTADIDLGNPNFTYLSLRSNVVLRWEYVLGSTVFVVWQHGRSESNNSGQFNLERNLSDLFAGDRRNEILVKINYWINP
jgi:Domain of unknown function (DUF5916)/Carbohydrate family 9 binding domain-like